MDIHQDHIVISRKGLLKAVQAFLTVIHSFYLGACIGEQLLDDLPVDLVVLCQKDAYAC